jgi:hypothetical protein
MLARQACPERVGAVYQLAGQAAAAQDALAVLEGLVAFLRHPAPSSLAPYMAGNPELQAQCWEELGDPETALIFRMEARRLDPQHTKSKIDLIIRDGIVVIPKSAVILDDTVTGPCTSRARDTSASDFALREKPMNSRFSPGPCLQGWEGS